VIVVDSCGWLEHFAGSRRGEVYRQALQDARDLLVPVVCLIEVYRTLARQAGDKSALDAVGIMSQGDVVALAGEDAVHVARLGLSCRLPLADSIIYATARLRDAELWTHDEHFRGLPGVRFVGPPVD
jgi:toxin FitB